MTKMSKNIFQQAEIKLWEVKVGLEGKSNGVWGAFVFPDGKKKKRETWSWEMKKS